ncbi:hypothetical protein [Desulfovibrio sp. DV]|uniref:hypothetical protein n=1 Tax=Desulfovibrio sp. DV TaxID=1844708 RepID=UPI001115161C|nr:hypothetical protein [Desulfovibrio sp. DV]
MSVLASEWDVILAKLAGNMRGLIGTLLEFFPVVLVSALLCVVICVCISKYFDVKAQDVVVAVVAYASCGLFLGFCVGYSQTPLIGAVLGFSVPVLTGLLGVLFKEPRAVLVEYAPICLGAVTAMVSTLLISIVYASKLYK